MSIPARNELYPMKSVVALAVEGRVKSESKLSRRLPFMYSLSFEASSVPRFCNPSATGKDCAGFES